MQCSTSHVRDISKLVQMIEEQEQCTINDSKSRTSSASSTSSTSTASDDDEGVDMDYTIASNGIESLVGLQQWRSGDRRDSCIRVTKPVRMRKRSGHNGVSKRRSS